MRVVVTVDFVHNDGTPMLHASSADTVVHEHGDATLMLHDGVEMMSAQMAECVTRIKRQVRTAREQAADMADG